MKRILATVALAGALLAPAAVFGQAGDGDTVQLNFNGVSLKEVVRAVEKLSGKRFLFDDALVADKKVSLFSSNPFPASRVMEVFESILEVEGLTVVRSGEGESEIYKIVDLASALKRPTPTFKKEDLESLRPGDQVVTLLLPLEHAAAEDVAQVLQGMATLAEGVAPVPGTNMLRVTDFAANAKRLAALVDHIDREGPRLVAETVVLENMDPVDLAEEIRPLIDIENRLEMSRLQRGLQQQVQRIMGNRGRVQPGMIQISGTRYTPVAVTPVPRLGAVIVSAEEARVQGIVDLIKRLDVSDAGQKGVRYYTLKYASATGAAAILSGIFDISLSGMAGGRGSGRVRRAGPSRTSEQKSATIIPDEDLKTLVVVAPLKVHGEIEEVLANVDRPGPNENVLRIHAVKHADLVEIATVVARLFGISLQQEAARMRMISMANARRGGQVLTAEEIVIPDENLNALLVVGPPALHEKVVEALASLDVQGPGLAEVRAYALQHADADEVASTLGGLFDISVGGGRRGRGFRMVRTQSERSAVIVANRAQGRIMVSASAEMHEQIAEVVRQLDAEGPNDTQIQYIPVANADVEEAAAVVSQVFGLTLGSATAGPGRGRGSRTPLEQSVVIPDVNLGSLIVVAPRDVIEKIREAVAKIDVAGPGEKVVRFHRVVSADVEEVARILSGIFEIELQTAAATSRNARGRRPAAATQRNAVIIPHPELSQIVVVAPKTTQDEVEKVIRQIDTAGPQENELRYYPLRHADITETANVLSQVFGFEVGSPQRSYRPRGRPGEEGRTVLTATKVVIPDTNLNSLLVVAPADVHAEVAKTVERLDVVGPMDNELRFYEVDDDFTTTTAQTLSQIFNIPVGSATQARRARASRAGSTVKFGADPVIIPDAAFGSVIVNAPVEIHAEIQKVLEQLQVLGRRERMTIRFYKIKNTDAAEVASKLGSLFNITVSNVTTGRAPARSAARASNASSRSGPRRPVDEEEEEPEDPAALEPAPGSAAAPAGGPQEYSWGGEPVVVPDAHLNSVIVIAPEYLLAEIERILERLDVRRPQVLFEVAILDITADRDLDLGVEFSTIDPSSDNARGHGLTSFGIGSRPNSPTGGFPTTTTVPGGDRGIFAGISKGTAGSLPVLVKLLQQNSDVNIRSTPLLLVNDNEQAEFSALRSEPTTRTSQGTATTTVSFSGFVDAGTVLRITPHVSEGNYIRLEIYLQVDSWLGASTTPGIPPPKSTNFLDTSITVPNERTVIIGGLSSLTRSTNTEKVPLLGDIPLLGWLFRREITSEASTRLFLFIKPTILSDEKFVDLNAISDVKAKEAEKADE